MAQPLRRELAEELRAHLLESVQAHVEAGMSEEEAVSRALAEFGPADAVRGELKTAYGGNLLTLLVQRAMDWRERTMKTEWKWRLVAQTALVMALAVGYFALMGWVVFVVPLLAAGYGEPSASLTQFGVLGPVVLNFSRFLGRTWWVWPALLAAGWGVFECRCAGENKGVIRLAGGAVACLALVVVAAMFSTATMVMCINRTMRLAAD